MNIFLFLYPIKPYFEICLKNYCWPDPIDYEIIRELGIIIDERYRQQGYNIYWLMFRIEHNLSKPDIELLCSYIGVCNEDIVIASGISFKKHTTDKSYPDPSFIFNQLPSNRINRLVLGGFHLSDCVEKLSQYLSTRGINVSIDKECTELFFLLRLLRQSPQEA